MVIYLVPNYLYAFSLRSTLLACPAPWFPGSSRTYIFFLLQEHGCKQVPGPDLPRIQSTRTPPDTLSLPLSSNHLLPHTLALILSTFTHPTRKFTFCHFLLSPRPHFIQWLKRKKVCPTQKPSQQKRAIFDVNKHHLYAKTIDNLSTTISLQTLHPNCIPIACRPCYKISLHLMQSSSLLHCLFLKPRSPVHSSSSSPTSRSFGVKSGQTPDEYSNLRNQFLSKFSINWELSKAHKLPRNTNNNLNRPFLVPSRASEVSWAPLDHIQLLPYCTILLLWIPCKRKYIKSDTLTGDHI